MPLFIISIFVSAFLLFQVQPIIARYILPWYGGSPAVWTTCMLFFQIGLLAGYAYAHLLASVFREKRLYQFVIHLGLVACAALFFSPITPAESLKPSGDEISSIWGIVKLLATTVGLPYLAISASGPLLQHWFSGACPGRSPYRLYAVSNIGSLLGLLSYPFLFEPALGLKHQTIWWSAGFVIYGILALVCAWAYFKGGQEKLDDATEDSAKLGESEGGKPLWIQRILWVVLAALGSATLLAVTNQMCQDVSVVPFLWVLPLALYLLTFILGFDRAFWYQRWLWVPLMLIGIFFLGSLLRENLEYDKVTIAGFSGAVVILGLIINFAGNFQKSKIIGPLVGLAIAVPLLIWFGVEMKDQFGDGDEPHLFWQLFIYMITMFATCMVCHGEMVRLKPGSSHLTGFYLLMSFGGALGGAFVSLIAPSIFNGYWELHIVLIVVPLLVACLIAWDLMKKYSVPHWGGLALIAAMLVVLPLAGILKDDIDDRTNSVASMRSFYGVVHVYESGVGNGYHRKDLYHGRITHGQQYMGAAWKNVPTTYYTENSGVGALMQSLPQRQPETKAPLNMAVIGLGAGSLAVHADKGDSMVFYEINPQIAYLADTEFTYLKDCEGDASVVLGDARTSMEQELKNNQNRNLDVLFVDAFSGDSIPVHLVTKEAFDIYFEHIKDDGSLCMHITNHHIDLSDPVRQLAKKFGCETRLVICNADDYTYYSEWVIITKNQDVLARLGDWSVDWRRDTPKEIHWTDDYSNLLDVVMF